MVRIISLGFIILVTIIGGSIGYGKLQGDQKKTEEKVAEVKVIVKEHTVKINTNENKTIEHAVIIQRTVAMLDKLEERFNSRKK